MLDLKIIEHDNQRILTTQQLADGYGTTAQYITNNFNRNKNRYVLSKHYYCLEGEVLRDFRTINQIDLSLKLNKLYLWTERGALLHAKSLNTDKAWEVYDILVDTYFRAQEMTANHYINDIKYNVSAREEKLNDVMDILSKPIAEETYYVLFGIFRLALADSVIRQKKDDFVKSCVAEC